MGKNNKISSNDKNSLIMLAVLITLLALAFVFFNVSRSLPLSYLAIFIIVFEIGMLPVLCKNYYKLHNQEAGVLRFIPYVNMLSMFPKYATLFSLASFVITLLLVVANVVPFYATSIEAMDEVMRLKDNLFSFAILAGLTFNVSLGVGFTSVYKHLLDLKEEYNHGKRSKTELAYFFMLYMPFLRCFALYNMNNVIGVMLSTGYQYGVDYSKLKIEEE